MQAVAFLKQRLWPKTLLWRTFILIMLLMGLSLVAWFQIYNQFAKKPRTRQAAQMVASAVNLTRAALLASDENQRAALLHELTTSEGIRIVPKEADDQIVEMDDSDFMERLSVALRARLGPNTFFASSLGNEPGFYVSFILDPDEPEDQYWLMLPRERIQREDVAGWIGWGVAAMTLSMLGAYFIVFGITRPLKALEQAAKKVGQGELPPPLEERGSREVVAVAAAFNQMSDDLRQLDSDRALILAGVSHDLRTPMTRLRLGIEMSGADSADIQAMSADIDDMDRIIKQFLDFAKDDHSEALTSCRLDELLSEIVANYARRGITINLVAQPGEFGGLRRESLRRAIINLIDNALRYAGETPEISLSMAATHGFVDINIADRGPGIPADQVERLKRPFTRLEQARTNVQGSGLGLAIVERVCRQHDGQLDLLPRDGGGLLARIRLPAHRPS